MNASDSANSYEHLAPLEQMDQYVRLFMDLNLWEPFARMVCARHGLPCERVRAGLAGTCPTFIIDRRWVVKFFGRLFEGGRAYAVELEAARLVSNVDGIPAPAVLAAGQLYPPDANWHWPYLVFEFIPGVSIGDVWGSIPTEERLNIAAEIGEIVRRMHQVPLGDSAVFQPDGPDYRAFMKAQRSGCAARLRKWGRMPVHLIDQVDTYLSSTDLWISQDDPVHFIHADLTRDHLLGKLEQGRWITAGLIDFGDARVGDLYYELAALQLDLFDCDKGMLRRFLETYGSRKQDQFVQRAMTAALLHQFDVVGPLFERFPNLNGLARLEEFADWLWNVDQVRQD
jgi:hygromycin-B 7''-O-kinase